MYSFSVVIDYAKNPEASTGQFECVYRQPTTPLEITKAGAEALHVHGTAIPLHLQSNEKLLDKASVLLSTKETCVTIFSKLYLEYRSLNIIRESDNNVPFILNQNNKRDDFKSHTKMKTRTDPSKYKNYFALKIYNEPCARKELIAMPEYITYIPTALVKQDSDDGLDLNSENDKKIHVYMTHIEPNAMSDLYNNDNFDLNSKEEACDYVKPEKLIAIAKLHDGDHLHLNPNKEMCFSMTHLVPNITIGPYNIQAFNPEKDSFSSVCVHTELNVIAEPDKFSLDPDKDMCSHEHGPNAVK